MSPQTEAKASAGFKAGVKDYKLTYYTPEYETKDTDVLAFLVISSVIPTLAFIVSGVLAPPSEGPEKLSSYESGIEPIRDAWVQFRIRY